MTQVDEAQHNNTSLAGGVGRIEIFLERMAHKHELFEIDHAVGIRIFVRIEPIVAVQAVLPFPCVR